MKSEKQNKYEVRAELSEFTLTRATNSFLVKCDNSILGKLQFSRGSIKWFLPNGKRPVRNLTWKEFADIMEKKKFG